MGMFMASKITDGTDTLVATGTHGNDDQPSILQVAGVEDNGLQVGAVYTLTLSDGTGYRNITYTSKDGTLYNFDYQSADQF
jgi:hypothetical protein